MLTEPEPAPAPEPAPVLSPDDAAGLAGLAAETAPPEPAAGAGPAPVNPAPPAAPAAETWQPILAGLLPVICAVLVPGWAVTEAEINRLADGCAPVLDKYFPSPGGERWAAEWAAFGALAEVAAPRVLAGTSRKAAEGAPDTAEAPPDGAPAGAAAVAARAGFAPGDPALSDG